MCCVQITGDDITALLLAPVGGCKISYKTMQVEQTATLLHALKCEPHANYINTVLYIIWVQQRYAGFKFSSIFKQNTISNLAIYF